MPRPARRYPISNRFSARPGHMLMVNADLTDTDHVHPEEPATRGPVITFQPLMPAPGLTSSGSSSSVTAW